MKHLRKGVSVASVLCLLLSLAAVWMAPGALAAPRSRSAVKTTVENGTQYKLSGYRDALDDLTRTVGDTGAAMAGAGEKEGRRRLDGGQQSQVRSFSICLRLD